MDTHSMVPDQIKRDAKWVMHAPSLMQITPQLDGIRWLNTLGCEIESLRSSLKCGYRLGRYYENIINSILNTSSYIYDLKENIKVRNNLKTLGEFDIVGRHRDGYDFHLECAIKFFLCTGDGSSLAHFEGPNRHDRLDLKWQKMNKQQIALSDHPAAQHALEALGYHVSRRLLMIQGFLFYPYGTPRRPSCPELNSHHNKGWWMRISDIDQLPEGNGYHLFQKPHWLALHTQAEPLTLTGLKAQLVDYTAPVMIARLERSRQRWIEKDRGFIVPESW